MAKLFFDHLVLAVPNLKEAIEFFQENLGVTPMMGGRHVNLGTHNALLGLGSPSDNAYLELLAIDPEDTRSYKAYSMGLTKDLKESYVASWCLRCDSEDLEFEKINETLRNFGKDYDHGPINKMQRLTPAGEILSWQIAISREQVIQSKGLAPFLIKWDRFSDHPTTRISKDNFLDYGLKFSGDSSQALENNLQRIGFIKPAQITFTSPSPSNINTSNLAIYFKLNVRGSGRELLFEGKDKNNVG